eukprot:359599-Chlamydomonas_euryale.AAC.2
MAQRERAEGPNVQAEPIAAAVPGAGAAEAAQLKELLVHQHAKLPVWLNPERFLQADFDADAVVLDLRRYVGARDDACTALRNSAD